MNETKKTIFERLLANEVIPMDDPDYGDVRVAVEETMGLNLKLNNAKDLDEVRKYLGEIIGTEVDETTTLFTPFYTNVGRHIKLGKNVFINHACSFLDLGGIEIEDNVMIGPRVNISSENHPTEIGKRNTMVPQKVTIKKGAWLGANVTVLPGITIGENSVVAAGALVNKMLNPIAFTPEFLPKRLKNYKI